MSTHVDQLNRLMLTILVISVVAIVAWSNKKGDRQIDAAILELNKVAGAATIYSKNYRVQTKIVADNLVSLMRKQLSEATSLSFKDADLSSISEYINYTIKDYETFTTADLINCLSGEKEVLWLNIALDKTLPFPSHSGNATEVEVKNFDQNTGQLVCAVGWKSETDFGKFDATFSYSYMFQKQAVAIISQTNANGKKEYGVGDFLSNKDRRVSIGDLPGIAAIETETEFTDILGMTVK